MCESGFIPKAQIHTYIHIQYTPQFRVIHTEYINRTQHTEQYVYIRIMCIACVLYVHIQKYTYINTYIL